ncbi:hypothetical protein [uncultured Deefgea sp.]|uniref:hypothetical protein n=1 Tax=uncultured Deefgea sp. TaxID=1304914 RepID=UPI002597700C|nr:hypothetical protein [uncultured Deefgea sp.]
MTIQFQGINLYTLPEARDQAPQLHARIVEVHGDWLILFGKKMAFTDDADLVAMLREANQTTPSIFSSKTAAADFLDLHASAFASISC